MYKLCVHRMQYINAFCVVNTVSRLYANEQSVYVVTTVLRTTVLSRVSAKRTVNCCRIRTCTSLTFRRQFPCTFLVSSLNVRQLSVIDYSRQLSLSSIYKFYSFRLVSLFSHCQYLNSLINCIELAVALSPSYSFYETNSRCCSYSIVLSSVLFFNGRR